MIQYLQRRYALSRKGAMDSIKGILSCALQNISFMLPVGLLYLPVNEIMNGTLTMQRIPFYVVSCIAAALIAPVVNTGVFAVGMLTVFRPILAQYAGGTDVVPYLFVAFIRVDFRVEFAVNAVLSAAIARIVQVVRKQLEK